MSDRFDRWLDENGPTALVMREYLQPVDGDDGVVFPPTFAASEDKTTFRGGYNIDRFEDGTNVCILDTVGSQANRIEPMFAKPPYSKLVPQVVVNAGALKVNLLDAGHRAGDAIVRCSSLEDVLKEGFQAVLRGDVSPLAKVAPTSLVFGAWDSRDTQAKLPRLVSSTIRAFNVRELHRSAQYVPALKYVREGLLDEAADKKTEDRYSQRGFNDVPAAWSHGGVIARGGIRRDVVLHLAVLRTLAPTQRELGEYLLGLALVAFTSSPIGFLRQGCVLVRHVDKSAECHRVYLDGRREAEGVTHSDAVAYAEARARAFGVGEDRSEEFSREKAAKDGGDEKKATKKKSEATKADSGSAGKAAGSAKKKG